MKIIVVSDTHGDFSILQRIYLKHQNADIFIHCGDSELAESYLDGYVGVKGNCDYESNLPKSRIITTPYGDIFIEHGNNYKYKDLEYIKSKNCLIYLYGHTHCHYYQSIDNHLFIMNPGSIIYPRDGSSGTYLEIELSDSGVKHRFLTE